MAYTLIQDICKHEDYPCCGCSTEPYVVDEVRARWLIAQGKAIDCTPMLDCGEYVKEFANFVVEHPIIPELHSPGRFQFEIGLLGILGDLDCRDSYKVLDAIYEALGHLKNFQPHISELNELMSECDWEDPNEHTY